MLLRQAGSESVLSHVFTQERDRMAGPGAWLCVNVTRRAESDRVHPSHQLLSTRFYARSKAGELWSPIQQTRLLASPERSAHLIAGRCSLLVRRPCSHEIGSAASRRRRPGAEARSRPDQPTRWPLVRESSTDADAGSECQRTVRLRRPPAAGVEERIDDLLPGGCSTPISRL